MMKKLILLFLAVLSAASLPAQAARQDEITMLVVPAEKVPVQIAQDISRRYPVLIVSYELVKGQWNIYAWDDEKWVPVSKEDYADGIFFSNRPAHAVVVEHERFRAPAFLTPNSIWCGSASRISSTDPRVMIHLLGLHFDFPYRHWDQFAKRYGYELEEINPTLENVHWWNIRADKLIEKRAKRDFTKDAGKWQPLATLPPPPVEPVQLEKTPVIPEIEKPAAEPARPLSETVDIKVKAAAPAEKAPVIKPVAPAPKPAPAPMPIEKPALAAEKEPLPQPEPAVLKPAAPAETVPAAAPAIEPVATEEPAPAPLIEKTASAAQESPAPLASRTALEIDPFTSDEVPAAEIVVPQPPKKPWWKF